MEPDQILERIAHNDETLTVEELSAALTELTNVQSQIATDIKGNKGGTFAELTAAKAEYDAVTDALAKVSDALTTAQDAVAAIIADVKGGDDPAVEAEEEPVIEAEVVPVAASIRTIVDRARRTTVVSEPVPADLSNVTTSFTLMGRDRDNLTRSELGKAFKDAARNFGGSKTVVASIHTELHPDRTLNGDASANERKMLDLFSANPVIPVTASGGCCSIPEPIYDQPLIGSLDRPIRDSFDALNASRGAVQAYPPVCIPDEGADVWTCEQDSDVDPDDPDTWKSCATVACEDSEPTLVEPIFKCLGIGTFQQRFASEQWEAHMFQTDKLAARIAEARLFNWLAESATSVYAGFATGSTYANFIKTQIRLAAAMRQDQRLGDAQIVTYGPEWIYSAIAEDTLTRRLNAVEDPEVIRAKVNSVLADEGITYVGSQDIASMNPFSYSGSIPAYPANAPTVMIPAGSAKFLDGGDKNLGIIEDTSQARQNSVAAFSEFWEGLLVRNCNVVFANIPVASCTTIPCPA